jgi:hypothetical protein
MEIRYRPARVREKADSIDQPVAVEPVDPDGMNVPVREAAAVRILDQDVVGIAPEERFDVPSVVRLDLFLHRVQPPDPTETGHPAAQASSTVV